MIGQLRVPFQLVLMTGMILIGMTLSYHAAKKGDISRPLTELAAVSQAPETLSFQRFLLGEILAPSFDEELHYIKIEVELRFLGNLEKELEDRKLEMKELVSQTLAKMSIQRAKVDFADGFLQKDLETAVNRLLGKTKSMDRVEKVTISAFLVN